MRSGKGKTHLKNMNALGNHFVSVQKHWLGNVTHLHDLFSLLPYLCDLELGSRSREDSIFFKICRTLLVGFECNLQTMLTKNSFSPNIWQWNLIFARLISSHSSDISNVSSQIRHLIQGVQSDTLPHHPFLLMYLITLITSHLFDYLIVNLLIDLLSHPIWKEAQWE